MFIDLPGIVGSRSGGGGGFPPAGTWLSSVCSGPDAHDQGAGQYTDANSTPFFGMFTLWEQFADGNGGSYWVNYGNNTSDGRNPTTSCWLPQYFYFYNESGTSSFYWEACGSSGNFSYGSYSSYAYSDGNGSTVYGGGSSNWYSAGYTIYDSGCCQVYYDGNSGYYYSDNCGGGGGCDSYGTYLGSTCLSTSGTDASGQYWNGTWTYADIYADGNCGQYYAGQTDNANGCYYPSGYWYSYNPSSSVLYWYVYDACGNGIASGSYTFATYAEGYMADGYGGQYYTTSSWSAEMGTQISSGTFTDCYGNFVNYIVTYDGNGEYAVQYSS